MNFWKVHLLEQILEKILESPVDAASNKQN